MVMKLIPNGNARRSWLMLAAAGLCAGVIGCAAAPKTGPQPVEIAAEEYGRMYQAAIDVLREEGLVVARQDYRFGRVVSEPFAAGTIAEPWRKPHATLRQAARSTLSSQRRVVTVSIEPTAETDKATGDASAPPDKAVAERAGAVKGDYQVRVEVSIEQLQAPRRYLTGSATGKQVFGDLSSVPTELAERGVTDAYWQPVGTDPHLAQHLIDQIVRRSVKIRTPGPPGPESADGPDTTEAPPTGELTGQ